MSTTKSREELVRLAWLTELRRQGHRQGRNWGVGRGPGRKVCALQLLWEIAGRPKYCRAGFYHAIAARAGLDQHQMWTVVRMNDGICGRTQSFSEIADVVASWFPERRA